MQQIDSFWAPARSHVGEIEERARRIDILKRYGMSRSVAAYALRSARQHIGRATLEGPCCADIRFVEVFGGHWLTELLDDRGQLLLSRGPARWSDEESPKRTGRQFRWSEARMAMEA